MASVARDDVFKNIDVYINEADMTYWKVVMPGPVGSPYEKGTFVLSVQMTDSFPNIPPVVRFLTPILHPNVTKVWEIVF
jgi:ubiquitin-protein ligase